MLHPPTIELGATRASILLLNLGTPTADPGRRGGRRLRGLLLGARRPAASSASSSTARPRSTDTSKFNGYVPEEKVIALAEGAGFVLDAKSEINANPKDSANYEGAWTLPPTLVLGETDREKYLAIGESDRMTLRFDRKP